MDVEKNTVKNLRLKIFEKVVNCATKKEIGFNEILEEIVDQQKNNVENSEEFKKAVFEMFCLAFGFLPKKDFNFNFSNLLKEVKKKQQEKENLINPPLVNIIKPLCNGCKENGFFVTNFCQGCLKRPCKAACPKDAIYFDKNKKSVIDKEKCIKCGRCFLACPYSAIVKQQRPCKEACGVDAIKSDELKRAEIDKEKCVSCGSCILACPFGAIFDKTQIFELVSSLEKGEKIVACVAPAFVGQFGNDVDFKTLKAAFLKLGFLDLVEVAIGADLCSFGEAKEFVEKVPKNQPFMATSCCPAWSVMAKKNFKELAPYISMELTPMAFTGRLIKSKNKNVKVLFVGPCTAKKLEAFRKSVRSDVDFVLTFEEMSAIFKAKKIDFSSLSLKENEQEKATADGRGFAISNGVANAVLECVKKLDPKKEVFLDSAQGLKECKKMLLLAKAGKRNGYLLEGMACLNGCVGGAGTIQKKEKSFKSVEEFAKNSKKKHAFESEFIKDLEELLK